MNRVTVERLPKTRELDGPKRWLEDKGEFIQISYREDIGHLAVFELKSGFSRGSHYHDKKEEIFYIVRGKIQAAFVDVDSQEKEEYILEPGHKVRVQTRCAHVFYAVEDSLVVEYSPQYYDKRDGHKMDLGV